MRKTCIIIEFTQATPTKATYNKNSYGRNQLQSRNHTPTNNPKIQGATLRLFLQRGQLQTTFTAVGEGREGSHQMSTLPNRYGRP